MKIATWNVNGIRAREAQLCDWLERDRPDVVCLQEIKARPDQVPERCKLTDYHAFWHGGGGYSGVSLHLKRELLEAPEFSHPHFDIETRIVQVTLGNMLVASVYVPNGGKDYAAKIRFMTHLVEWSKQMQAEGRELILCGDINIARADIDVHPRERKADVIGQRQEERDLFQALLDASMVDVTRKFDPDNDRLFSWWPPWRNMRQRNIGWRIDYILASRTLADRASACTILADVGTSDHAPIMMTTG
ncbi:MAG TPA: exodeoxyribonuclease III [Casimicrobiaceae bacterium]|nr:exodeoxyribonuclease III [Casimicrobiaceae bacterium]